MKRTLLAFAFLAGCSSAPVEPDPVPTVVEEVVEVLGPVAHDGPMSVDPGFYDCGNVPDGYTCEFETRVTISTDSVTIDEIGQNFSPWARVSLTQESTGFNRELPYEMRRNDPLIALFYYRRDDPNDETGGTVQIQYRSGAESYTLVMPVGGE